MLRTTFPKWCLFGLAILAASISATFRLANAYAYAWSMPRATPLLSLVPNSQSRNRILAQSPKSSRGQLFLQQTPACASTETETTDPIAIPFPAISRRQILQGVAKTTATTAAFGLGLSPLASHAYTPDPDKLQESLYFISRVQEATVQQERFINKLGGTLQLRTKLKLTLRLVDKNYKLLDQINYSSAFITPPDMLVEASEAGYEAVDALQTAIEFVKKDEEWAAGDADERVTNERKALLVTALQTCRERLLVYTQYMPDDKLTNARLRVERENIDNRDEFDGDEDAGVYNPVNLPWKPVLKATADYKKK